MFLRQLVLVILCGLLSGMQGGIQPAYQRVVSPDDGPIVARNM